MSDNEWRELVADMRKQKKEFDAKNENNGEYYRPIRQHPFLKNCQNERKEETQLEFLDSFNNLKL